MLLLLGKEGAVACVEQAKTGWRRVTSEVRLVAVIISSDSLAQAGLPCLDRYLRRARESEER